LSLAWKFAIFTQVWVIANIEYKHFTR